MSKCPKETIFEKQEDNEHFYALNINMQESILEDLSRIEEMLGRRLYISTIKKSTAGINVIYSSGNLF